MAKNKEKAQLNARLEALLGKTATRQLMEDAGIDLTEYNAGTPLPKIADLVVYEVVKMALKGKEWAIQLAYDRTEGKTPTGQQTKEDGRILEERLDTVTQAHINALAESIIYDEDNQIKNVAAGLPSSDEVDLSKDGPDRPQNAHRESPVAQEIAAGSHQ